MAVDLFLKVDCIKEPPPQPPSPCHTPLEHAEDLIQIQTLSVICHPKVPRPWIDTVPQNHPRCFSGQPQKPHTMACLWLVAQTQGARARGWGGQPPPN